MLFVKLFASKASKIAVSTLSWLNVETLKRASTLHFDYGNRNAGCNRKMAVFITANDLLSECIQILEKVLKLVG